MQTEAGRSPALRGSADLAKRPRWYLVHAQTGREHVAETNLSRQNYRSFLPKYARTTRHARKLVTRDEALFPGYLFVALDLETDRWSPINGTLGVVRLVSHRSAPVPVPEGVVECLIDAARPDGRLERKPAFRPGDRVRMIAGPFADRIAEVVELSGGDRVKLLLDLLSSSIHVTVDVSVCETSSK